ncbi:hypothetical protein HYH03_013088 [Edaphochlamys debaryana]|uniref:DUF2322 family protein n=1 Tax=Edaphochlamys debaryana TaxID=47281 RepID=A0A835XZC6_9CHLO|nr:hypothetical protein HYH03_013088 [Edaphochlamys debaryana]|eukprot:KAG2488404.1 hypothetical protein HYH03_013088 [Edaphochlamys debaryana]
MMLASTSTARNAACMRAKPCTSSAALPARSRVVAHGLKENVAKLAPIDDIARVRIPALNWSVENVEGKKASVAIYAHLAAAHGGKLNVAAAQEGLRLYDEVVADARQRPGAHPNIDLLFKVEAEGASYDLAVERK